MKNEMEEIWLEEGGIYKLNQKTGLYRKVISNPKSKPSLKSTPKGLNKWMAVPMKEVPEEFQYSHKGWKNLRKAIDNLCTNCKKREATINWVGTGGIMDFAHGNYTRWCEICSLEANLKYAKKQAKQIPILERKLERLYRKEKKLKT